MGQQAQGTLVRRAAEAAASGGAHPRPGAFLGRSDRPGSHTHHACDTSQREQARAELSIAMEMYRGMAMTFWLPETEAALAQVEGR
jgi:hypothetical protein